VEAQNHYYGHSAAFASYLGLSRPRHVAGLVQHGWAALSPVQTHFRDFPRLGRPGDESRRLLVWSHGSRAWDPQAELRRTVPIGAPFVYLSAAAGATPEPTDPRQEVVLMPVHGIQTQRLRGDHHGLAARWRDEEGPATACLYAADAADPDIVDAYRSAGHRLVVLGERHDARFLWRLWTMLGRSRRVVSNRLSTPVVYAAHLGADVGVYGDPLEIDGETPVDNDRVRTVWPELHGQRIDPNLARELADLELGVQHLLEPQQLREALGWSGSTAGPMLEFWTRSPASRAITTVRRRADSGPAPAPAAPQPASEPAAEPASEPAPPSSPAKTEAESHPALNWGAWLRGALTYLPRPLPRHIPQAGQQVEPIDVP
jgi:hypothetical protein